MATWLKPGLQYDLIVDLSRYAYSEDSGTSLSSEAREQILNNLERKSVRFVVRPFSFDGKLRLKASEDVLRAPIPQLIQPSTDEDLARIAKLRKGEISIPELAHDDAAHFKVTPMARGCAAIGVSVWDESGLVPVDHFVISVPIAENGKHIPSCGNNRQARVAVEKGTSSFLRLSLERGPPEPEPVASLHIFEAEVLEKTRTAVFMVEGGTYKESAGRKGLYVWVTETLLTDYMTTPLWTQIDEARRNVQAKRSYGYAQVAQEFALKLFSGSTEGQRKAAKKARNALRSAVAASANPTVVVRMVTRSGDHLLIPLALLGARAQDPIVTKPLTVVEPLMIERYSANQPCIAAWTLAIPKKLSGVDDVEMEAALRGIEKLSDFTAVLKTQQELISYVSDPKPEGTAEGLILLAHHDQGYLWFDNVSSRLSTEMLTRRFAPGSVAILSACATANPGGDHLAWVRKLNEHGMDAMVVSPFPVPAGYAARLAVDFGTAVQTAVRERRAPTFLELFHNANKATAAHFRKASLEYDELALEFVVAGDVNIRLCAPR